MPDTRAGRRDGGANRFGPGANEHRVGGRHNYGNDNQYGHYAGGGGNRRDENMGGYDRSKPPDQQLACAPFSISYSNLESLQGNQEDHPILVDLYVPDQVVTITTEDHHCLPCRHMFHSHITPKSLLDLMVSLCGHHRLVRYHLLNLDRTLEEILLADHHCHPIPVLWYSTCISSA